MASWRCGIVALVLMMPAFCRAEDDDSHAAIKPLLDELRKTKPELVKEIVNRLQLSENEVRSYKKGLVVFGQVVLDSDQNPQAVVSQMIVLKHGYFVDAIGEADKPIGFRLHGYEAVDVTPKGQGPLEDLGVIRMKKLPADRLASVKGQLEFERNAGEVPSDKIQVTWNISVHPINTPHNGTEGVTQFHQPLVSPVADDKSFATSGMTPTKYDLLVTAPDCVRHYQRVEFKEGETTELKPIRLERVRKVNVEFAVAKDCDFTEAKFAKTVLKADDRWRASDETPDYASDLMVSQKNGALLLRYVYAPCHILDMGTHELDDELAVDTAAHARIHDQEVPVVDGHVYLVHQPTWKHWILFRTTFEK